MNTTNSQPQNSPSQVGKGDPPAPFSCTYSPNLPELLMQLNCSIAISTYQAGKVVFISAVDENRLVQLPRTFKQAMGIAVSGNKMALATKNEVIVLANYKGLAVNYPKQPNTYDGLYMPRATYYTGQVDIHDLNWGTEGLWAINTSFSCLCLINENYSFEPKWQPSFISRLASEDRCHLNGMAMANGKPEYVSALGKSDLVQGWRENITNGGILINIDSDEIISKNLPMPHSPRLYDNKLYVLLSATGELARIDINNGSYEVIRQLDGFVRGMDKYGDYLFIGLSRLRQNSSAFRDLPIAQKALTAGIAVLYQPTGALVAELKYQSSVEEIYDVKVLPGLRRPGILNTDTDAHTRALDTPEGSWYGQV